MTDKQKINCKYKFQNDEIFESKHYCTLHNELCEDLSFACDDNCQIYEDYKQLKRAEKENEKHEELYKELEKIVFPRLLGDFCGYNEKTNSFDIVLAVKEIIDDKEQECDELKKTINEAKNSKLDLKSFLVSEAVQNEYEQQLFQLKAENEKLDTENKRLVAELANPVFDSFEELDKLKQTLSEIKDIAEENIRIADLEGLNGVYRRGLAKQILQKISEVENAR